mmetsp:Transcript_7989/g.20957  ORF Transcript_7989/g.20957 Transcript_7989/m.20957 type:complete len:235 (+) Transcript_7989:161-865(+)
MHGRTGLGQPAAARHRHLLRLATGALLLPHVARGPARREVEEEGGDARGGEREPAEGHHETEGGGVGERDQLAAQLIAQLRVVVGVEREIAEATRAEHELDLVRRDHEQRADDEVALDGGRHLARAPVDNLGDELLVLGRRAVEDEHLVVVRHLADLVLALEGRLLDDLRHLEHGEALRHRRERQRHVHQRGVRRLRPARHEAARKGKRRDQRDDRSRAEQDGSERHPHQTHHH